jgi:hypothetical protein
MRLCAWLCECVAFRRCMGLFARFFSFFFFERLGRARTARLGMAVSNEKEPANGDGPHPRQQQPLSYISR